MKIIIVTLLLLLQACTINRYYPAKKLNKQLTTLQREMDKGLAKIETDYKQKQALMKMTELAEPSKQLQLAHTNTLESTQKLQTAIEQIRSAIGKKSKIQSTDPAFKKLESFETQSQAQLAEVNSRFKEYKAATEALQDRALEKNIFFVNVSTFSTELRKFLTDFSSQISKFDPANVHVQELKKIQAELEEFRTRFAKASDGKSEYLVTPQHPQAALFKSFKEIQERIKRHVDAFNEK